MKTVAGAIGRSRDHPTGPRDARTTNHMRTACFPFINTLGRHCVARFTLQDRPGATSSMAQQIWPCDCPFRSHLSESRSLTENSLRTEASSLIIKRFKFIHFARSDRLHAISLAIALQKLLDPIHLSLEKDSQFGELGTLKAVHDSTSQYSIETLSQYLISSVALRNLR